MTNLYLHNLYATQTDHGYLLHKFPSTLISKLSIKGQPNAYSLHGSEIRLILLGSVEIEFYAMNTAQILVYYGDYQGEYYQFTGDFTLKLTPKFDNDGIHRLNHKHRYAPDLVRIILKETMTLKSIQGNYQYPDVSAFPKQRYLAYGTSISQGRNGLTPDLNYPSIVAETLGYELFNYSMSGSAYIEAELVDYMCETLFDLITLELSVNLLGDGYSVDVFKSRLSYLLEQISIKQPQAKVIGITILDNWRKLGFDQKRGTQQDVIMFREAFKSLMGLYPQFSLLNGEDILKFHHLSADLIHPSQYGMIEIAQHILEKTNVIR